MDNSTRAKADAAHVVPLAPAAVAILKSLPRFEGDFLFTSGDGRKPVSGYSKMKRRLDALMLAELQTAFEPFTLHDIRRTMRTHLSALPVTDLVRELCIAHTKPGLHKIYDQHSYLDEKCRAFELWAARLQGIITPPVENVVALRA